MFSTYGWNNSGHLSHGYELVGELEMANTIFTLYLQTISLTLIIENAMIPLDIFSYESSAVTVTGHHGNTVFGLEGFM